MVPNANSERLYEGQLLADVGGQPGILRDNPAVQIADAVNQLARATVVQYDIPNQTPNHGGALVISMRGRNVNEGDTPVGVYSNGSLVVAPGTRRWTPSPIDSAGQSSSVQLGNMEIYGHSMVQITAKLTSGSATPVNATIVFQGSVEDSGTNFFDMFALEMATGTTAGSFVKALNTSSNQTFGFLVRHSGVQRFKVKLDLPSSPTTNHMEGWVTIVSRAGNLL